MPAAVEEEGSFRIQKPQADSFAWSEMLSVRH
jgi:hypothetical protein